LGPPLKPARGPLTNSLGDFSSCVRPGLGLFRDVRSLGLCRGSGGLTPGWPRLVHLVLVQPLDPARGLFHSVFPPPWVDSFFPPKTGFSPITLLRKDFCRIPPCRGFGLLLSFGFSPFLVENWLYCYFVPFFLFPPFVTFFYLDATPFVLLRSFFTSLPAYPHFWPSFGSFQFNSS